MTKALYCIACGTIRTFRRNGGLTACECGAIKGWWVDGARGIAQLYVNHLDDRQYGRVIGLHNGFLRGAAAGTAGQTDDGNRVLHDLATDAPNYLFDKSRRSCWAVVIAPGESNDTSWATDEQFLAKQQEATGGLVG